MLSVKPWVKMPSRWVLDSSNPVLCQLRWMGPRKSDQISALIIYMVLVHHANDELVAQYSGVGWCALTYTRLEEITGMSRSKISGGLRVLRDIGLVDISRCGTSNFYHVADYGQYSGWAKLPARPMYSKDMKRAPVFHEFYLRSRNELNALKVFFLVVALRDNMKNYATVSYERICDYTGLRRNDVRPALSLLVNKALVHVDSFPTGMNEFSSANTYRLVQLETRKHRGAMKPDMG